MEDTTDTPLEDTDAVTEEPAKGLSPKGMSAMQGNDDIPVSQSLPGYESGGDVQKPSDWKDLGIVDVPVANLPDPDGVSSPDDFNHHISWEDAKSATERLPQIQQEVAAGKTRDDFTAEDEAAGLDWREGKRGVYDLYYSNTDPIQVDKDGEQYTINSGRSSHICGEGSGTRDSSSKSPRKNCC